MKKKIIILVAIIAVIVLVIVIKSRNQEVRVIKVIDNITASHLVVSLQQTGVIKPQIGAQISIGARATGMLEKVNVREGDAVKKGQLVARIDSRSIQQGIAQSNEVIKKVQVDLDKLSRLFPVQKAMQENTIKSAASKYDYLKKVFEREQVLYDKGYSRRETLEKAESDMITASTTLDREKLQLEYLIADHETQMQSVKAELARQKSYLKEQEIQLTYTEIYAPIDGIVSKVKSVEGETIVAGLEVANLITIFRPELLEMYTYVDETDIGKVQVGQQVRYTLDTYQNREFLGKIDRINLTPESKDGIVYYLAIVGISEEDALLLRPEMTTNVWIIVQEKDVDVTVANAAIKWENGEQVVYKVKNKEKSLTERIVVKIGIRGESRTEILSGLSVGDQVVVRFAAPGENSKNAKTQ